MELGLSYPNSSLSHSKEKESSFTPLSPDIALLLKTAASDAGEREMRNL
jgi:hypothetical protein